MRAVPASVHHPIDVLWQPATLLSVFAAGELLAILLAIAPDADGSRLVRFGLLSFGVQWVILFTLAALYALRRQLATWRPPAIVALAIALLFAMTVLSSALAGLLFRGLWSEQGAHWLPTGLRFFGAMLCMLLFGLLALRSHWAAQTQEYRAKQAELAALQARVDPHFLFNTLNTGIALVHARPDAAEQLLLDLADLFRAALSGPRTIPLAQELQLTGRYLDIERLRFGDRLHIVQDIPDALPAINVPALSIQPLVENAIRHGIEPSVEGGTVVLRVRRDAGTLVVQVENTLPTEPQAVGTPPGHHVGLASVEARVTALTEGRGRLEAARHGNRYIARLVLPA